MNSWNAPQSQTAPKFCIMFSLPYNNYLIRNFEIGVYFYNFKLADKQLE